MRNPPVVATGAVLSPCGAFRYSLERVWATTGGRCVFVGFNPSTADALRDDPTIRRCIGFAQAWGFGSLVMLNLFGFRATDPREIARQVDPVGPMNDAFIRRHAGEAERIVAAWGELAEPYRARARDVLEMLWLHGFSSAVYRLGEPTRSGHPRHPLYLAGDVELAPYLPGALA